MKLVLLAVLLPVVSGCATSLSPEAMKIREAQPTAVEKCQFLRDIQGTSDVGIFSPNVGMQNAKNNAREIAALIGATHIVWTEFAGGYSPFAAARAYRCP